MHIVFTPHRGFLFIFSFAPGSFNCLHALAELRPVLVYEKGCKFAAVFFFFFSFWKMKKERKRRKKGLSNVYVRTQKKKLIRERL